MNREKLRKVAVLVTTVGALAFGVGTSAFAEGEVPGRMSNWESGHRGDTWRDYNTDSEDTRVTFNLGCTREFTARLRKENAGPDTTVASEYINCGSYADAVRGGDLPTEDYHFDIQLSTGGCGKFSCVVPKTTGNYTEYW